MALARTYSMALAGVRGHVVEIEADIENGLVALLLVGLPWMRIRLRVRHPPAPHYGVVIQSCERSARRAWAKSMANSAACPK